jgi:arabinogalactan endo-1,4-beta-galactosidase
MKNITLILLLLFISKNSVQSQTFYKGADLSFVKELEGCGVQWKENNTVKDIFDIFKDNGANIIRFRIFHTPVSGKNGYADTESLISRAKAKGLKVMLDFFYSDTWADAGTQKCPAAWSAVVNNNSVLADSLYNYTKKVLQTLNDKGLMPEFVQVGNETNGGMCLAGNGTVQWPVDWSKQTLLFNAGIKAVRDVNASTKVILHIADPKNAEWCAGQFNGNGVTGYDILGVSFYPIWHTTETINDFGTIITNIKNTYQKDVMVVETGLPWTNSYDDNTTNVMNGVPAGYGSLPTPEIQAQWLTDLYNKMVAVGGIGIVYWEPDWVASHVANCPSDFGGSTWENVALFDFNNNLMANGGIKFCQLATGITSLTASSKDISLSVFPNPANSELNVQFNATSAAKVSMEIYDLQGRKIKTFEVKPVVGTNIFPLNISDLNIFPGLYVLHLTSDQISDNQTFAITR